MGEINNDVQSVVQNTSYIYKAVLDLWAMTPIELKMYIGIMITLSILMQYIKKTYLTKCTKKERVQKLWAFSFPIGIILAFIGYYVYIDKVHWGFSVFIGLTVSTVSMGVHRVVVDYVWPGIKLIIDAVWSRVMLMVRGAPSDDS